MIGVWGLGFGVWGLGFGVLGLWVVGWGLGVEGWGLGVGGWVVWFVLWGFEVWCLVFGIWGFGFWVLGSGFGVYPSSLSTSSSAKPKNVSSHIMPTEKSSTSRFHWP